MKKLVLASVLGLTILSCQKEEVKKTTCNCYERHEVADYFTPQGFVYKLDYESTVFQANCSENSGDWIYTGNNQQYRHRTICQ